MRPQSYRNGAAAMKRIPTTERTRVRRKPERGSYDRATINAILDEALVCHVGFAVDGQPYVIPATYGRIGDQLYLHTAVQISRGPVG